MSYVIKVPCCKSKLKHIREFVTNTLSQYPVSDTEASKMVLAVDEICSNLIIHSHQNNDQDSIEIKIDYQSGDGFKFEIIDKGESFSANNYKEPCLKDIIKTRRKGGMGLMLVKRIMDKVEFSWDEGSEKNVCRLYRRVKTSNSSAKKTKPL